MRGLASGSTAKAVLEPEPPDHEEGLTDDAAGHLGGALETVGEDDRHFGDAEPLAPDLVGQLDLEAVAIGTNGLEVELGEGLAAETLKTGQLMTRIPLR